MSRIYFKIIQSLSGMRAALTCYFSSGQVILFFFPDEGSLGASLLFILMNLIPMIVAAVFSLVLCESQAHLGESKVFLQRKFPILDLAFFIPIIYYGISILLMNVRFTGNSHLGLLPFISPGPYYGGLEEVG